MPGALRAECSNIAVCGIVGAVVRELLRASRDDRLTVTMKPEVARAAFGPFGEQHQISLIELILTEDYMLVRWRDKGSDR